MDQTLVTLQFMFAALACLLVLAQNKLCFFFGKTFNLLGIKQKDRAHRTGDYTREDELEKEENTHRNK